jgi:hypothetical protein
MKTTYNPIDALIRDFGRIGGSLENLANDAPYIPMENLQKRLLIQRAQLGALVGELRKCQYIAEEAAQ